MNIDACGLTGREKTALRAACGRAKVSLDELVDIRWSMQLIDGVRSKRLTGAGFRRRAPGGNYVRGSIRI